MSASHYIEMREQFGTPIGSFQALQHRAVDLFVLVELSRAVVQQSARRRRRRHRRATRAARRAAARPRRAASAAALEVAKGCIQLHGGIGYTDECNIGLFLKRAMVLAAWLGDAAWHRRRYGELAPAGDRDDEAPELTSADPLRRDVAALPRRELSARVAFSAQPPEPEGSARWQVQAGRERAGRRRAGRSSTAAWGCRLRAVEDGREFDRHGVIVVTNMGVVMLGPLLIRYGTEAQKREYLPRILSGELRWCQGYSEPGAGSDLAGLRTTAVLDGDDFVVNGQKIWTSFAHEADMIFMLVRTDPKAKKQDGISFLLADMKSPGITVRRIKNLTGSSEFCEVFFDNVRVPRANLVGGHQPGLDHGQVAAGQRAHHDRPPALARVRRCSALHELAKSRGLLDDAAWRARFDELRLDVDDLGALLSCAWSTCCAAAASSAPRSRC